MPDTSQIDYRQLASALLAESGGAAYKAVSSTPTTTYGHGPGGLFSNPALEGALISAMALPRMGLADILPIHPTTFANPLYGIVTGVTATTGTDPAGPCNDFKVAGLTKLCTQTSYLGRQGRMSRVMEVDRMGLLQDRGEHTDFRLLGGPASSGSNAPTIMGMGNSSSMLNTEIGKVLFELATAWKRDFAREFWTGNPTNNNAGGGVKYYRGMDLLINTGYRDAVTSVACAAADSDVRSFGNLDIATNGATLVRVISNMYRNRQYIARATGLDPVKFVLAMRWSAFYEITEVWPCAYQTYRCTNLATGSTNFVDSGQMVAMRDEMRGDLMNRSGQYLLIDGERVPVVIDDGIEELGIGAGTFRSSIYLVPLTVLGGTEVTYMEYLNYDAPNGALASARMMAPEGSYRTSDGGRFLWHNKPPEMFCLQVAVKTETRLILRTPFLAARLTGVQYTPIQHERDAFTDGTYFVNGGATSYNGLGPSYYTPTS